MGKVLKFEPVSKDVFASPGRRRLPKSPDADLSWLPNPGSISPVDVQRVREPVPQQQGKMKWPVMAIVIAICAAVAFLFFVFHISGQVAYSARANLLPAFLGQ
ncbi:hypothetical protein EV561_12042 [Rhizobium sp. BK376]|nr:hypothetical protein EV561_12042 [Rhizobium sp. BK376]